MRLTLERPMADKKHNVILTIIKSYSKGLLGFIRKRVDNEEDAEDILQDVWYQLSSVINSQPVEQVGGWLYRVANNKIIDKHRKKSELSWIYGEEEQEETSFYDQFTKTEKTPESEYQDRVLWQELFKALEELPAEQRDVFVRHELDRVSFAEISADTGEPVGKLISRKHYAVLHLRKRLKMFYSEFKESQFKSI